MPTNKEMWKKILPRPISTQILKEKLCVWLESNRALLEAKMNSGLGFVRPIYFSRTQKWKPSDGSWERIFDYSLHYGIGPPKPAPFFLVVTTDKEDVQILQIRCMTT